MSPSQRAALSIDALVDHVPSPPRLRQCGKCQEAHTRCDGRDPCHNCEVRGTLCGYAWSSFSAPPPLPAIHHSPHHYHPPPPRPVPVPHAPGYAQHVLYFPPPAKRPVRPPDPPLSRPPPADGGWAIVPAGTNAPAVTRGGEPGPPIKPCKTCQARNTICDGVVPVCGSCRTRRLECYIATPAATTTTIPERPRVQSMKPMPVHDKAPAPSPRGLAHSTAQTPSAHHPAPAQTHPARARALSSNEDGKPSRASLSFMLNPSPTAEQPVASTSRAPPPRPPELKRPPPTPTALVTPPTPVVPNGLEQAQSRMDIDARPPAGPVSPMLKPRPASPLSPSSSTAGGGADLSRRPSRKRSASPSSYRGRWGSSSPSRESVSSESYPRPSDVRSMRHSISSHSTRPSIDSLSGRPSESYSHRLSIDSHVSRHSIDSYTPPDEEHERRRSKSSLSHLLDGDGHGGMTRQPPAPTPSRPVSSSSSRPNSKRGSISTAMAGMQLKSATTSRASSPGSTNGRDRSHAWPTFSTVSETIGPDVWRNETEADMRRREVEAEERKKARQARGVDMEVEPEVDLQRRRSDGPKRRRIGLEEDPLPDSGVSIVEQIRRASGEASRRTSTDDTIPSRRTSADNIPVRRSSGNDAYSKRNDVHSKQTLMDGPLATRLPMVEPPIVVSDSPEIQSNDPMVLEADEPKDVLISSPVEAISVVNGISVDGSNKVSTNGVSTTEAPRDGSGKASVDGSSKTAADGTPTTASSDLPVKNAVVNGHRKDSINEIKRSPSVDSRNGSTPPTAKAFAHIWPPPSIATPEPTKKGRKKVEPEPAPSRSFITQRNLPPAPPPVVPADEDTKDNVNGAKDAGSSLRSMLTTMPPRAVFMSAVQTFLTQPKRKGRVVVMTKAMMKDALNVLLDPATDELLKDYVQPERAGSGSKLERSGSVSKLERSGSTSKLERSNSQRSASQSKDDDKSSRDGTPTQGRKPVDASDHTTLEFRAWARRMFSTVKTPRGEDALAFGGKPVTVEDDIYETIVLCHSRGNHCSAEETVRLVDQAHSWVPRVLVEAFVQECPGCPASNKVTSATSKPKKRKWVRKDDKQPAVTTKRKPATGRRGKGGRKKRPADESEEEQEQEPEQEVEEQEMEEDELGEEAEPEPEAEPEVEEDEMESEDETIARPASSKMDLDG